MSANDLPENSTPALKELDIPELDLSTLVPGAKTRIDRSSDKSKAVTFPVRTYTIKAVEDLKPQITSVKGSPSGDEIPEGGHYRRNRRHPDWHCGQGPES